jgi:hypothetical protein
MRIRNLLITIVCALSLCGGLWAQGTCHQNSISGVYGVTASGWLTLGPGVVPDRSAARLLTRNRHESERREHRILRSLQSHCFRKLNGDMGFQFQRLDVRLRAVKRPVAGNQAPRSDGA